VYNFYGNQHHSSNKREWLAEDVKGKRNLVICIGDSWTWGDSLGKSFEAPEYNDIPTRHKEFYTKKLADKLNADWLMIAFCGCSNNWILTQYNIIRNAIDKNYYKKYNNVYVHVSLTELFRDLHEIAFNPIIKDNFAQFCEQYVHASIINKIESIDNIPETHVFSKNFWNIDAKVKGLNLIDKTWQQLLFDNQLINDSVNIPVVSKIGLEPLVKFLRKNKLKKIELEFSEFLPQIETRIENMLRCGLNSKNATKHPTAQGHSLWADYIFNYYKS
jgi:hypothetical protein